LADELLKLAFAIVVAEEMSRSAEASNAQETVHREPSQRTYIGRLANIPIPATVVDENGSGALKELLIVSSHTNFEVSIRIDGDIAYQQPYTWFLERSNELEEIAAFQRDDGKYVLHISDLRYTKSIKIDILPILIGTIQRTAIDEVFYKIEKIEQYT